MTSPNLAQSGPLVSVLTPVWNEEEHLPTMLDSIENQSYRNWELLLVDDGSTDRTAEIIEQAAGGDARVRLVSTGARLGKVAAFNAAFRASAGEIICHVGGDDVMPRDALLHRVDALANVVETKAVGYFKLRMFADQPGLGTIVPRGDHGSRSGPSTTLTRPLAEAVFPVPTDLPSEDLWIGEAALGLATHVVHSPQVVLDYRVHAGNSNPRHKSFELMSESIHRRMAFAPALLSESRFTLNAEVRMDLARQCGAEALRYAGATMRLLRYDLPLIDRLALASMSDRRLWWLRQRGAGAFSGWRGR